MHVGMTEKSKIRHYQAIAHPETFYQTIDQGRSASLTSRFNKSPISLIILVVTFIEAFEKKCMIF
jgi:hypothetical protein